MSIVKQPQIARTVRHGPLGLPLDLAFRKRQHQSSNLMLLVIYVGTGIASHEFRNPESEQNPVFVEEIQANQALLAQQVVLTRNRKAERPDRNCESGRNAGILGVLVQNLWQRASAGRQRRNRRK